MTGDDRTTTTGLSRRALLGAAGTLGMGAAGLTAVAARADEPLTEPLRTRLVADAAELDAAIAAARPGDVILMKNGTWRDVAIDFRAVGTVDHPIVIRAQTPGSVVITGTSYLRIRGAYLVVAGLTFRDGAGPLDRSHLIQFSDWTDADPSDGGNFSHHCRLTNVVVDGFNKPVDRTDIWVGLWGHHNRIDHCAFLDKTRNGLTIVAWRPFGDPDHHRIDRNYFGNIPSDGPAGRVVIRIGDGNQATKASHTIVEKNVLEHISGIGNIINLKCSDTIVRDNTFREASGAINLRSGHRNVIERNFILPGIPGLNDYYAGGVLVIGEDHVIRGNYFQDCTSRYKTAIAMYQGDDDNAPGKGSYYPTRNVLIENNTFVDNHSHVRVGVIGGGIPVEDLDIPVENITYRENAVVGTDSPEPVINVINPPVGTIVYERNMFHGGNLAGLEGIDGIEFADPGLVQQPDGTYRYAPDSPLRHNLTTRPLNKDDVGPEWDWR